MKSLNKLFFNYLILLLSFVLLPVPASADEALWKSGMNLYIKLAKQDKLREGRTPPNQHPVSLSAREITNALNLIEVWNKHLFKRDVLDTAFSSAESRLLGQYLSEGLKKARPDQDIIFSIPRREKKYIVIQNMTYTAGRAFYANDKLHIIIGDYEKSPDRFKERMHQSSGIPEIKYFFNHGKRAKPSKFDRAVVLKEGIDIYRGGKKQRKDWFVIDVKTASATYLAKHAVNKKPTTLANDEAIRLEADKRAQENRAMRLEMARLRKEMNQNQARGGHNLSVEDRLIKLTDLKDKKLITDEEYAMKRKEIINEI